VKEVLELAEEWVRCKIIKLEFNLSSTKRQLGEDDFKRTTITGKKKGIKKTCMSEETLKRKIFKRELVH